MQHLSSLEQASLQNAWLTIGSFDGVHRGHREILRQLTAGAHANGASAVVLTFYPHPNAVLRGQSGRFYLTHPEERAELLGEIGVDVVITQTFDRNLAATSATAYMQAIKTHLGLKELWVGYDFALGRAREGDIPTLRRLGNEMDYVVKVIQPVFVEGQAISSSLVRAWLAAGEVENANLALGRPYRLAGKVIHGDGRGSQIGIPTANLDVWAEKILPAEGVYACLARVGSQTFPAATNIGSRPTFRDSAPSFQIETHLIDFSGNLYGQSLTLDFIARLRGERRFANPEELVVQIREDIQQTRSALTK